MRKESKTWLTLSQMAERLQVTPKTFRKYVEKYNIPCISIGRNLRFNPAVVEKHLEKTFKKIEFPSYKGEKRKLEIDPYPDRDFFLRELGLK